MPSVDVISTVVLNGLGLADHDVKVEYVFAKFNKKNKRHKISVKMIFWHGKSANELNVTWGFMGTLIYN